MECGTAPFRSGTERLRAVRPHHSWGRTAARALQKSIWYYAGTGRLPTGWSFWFIDFKTRWQTHCGQFFLQTSRWFLIWVFFFLIPCPLSRSFFDRWLGFWGFVGVWHPRGARDLKWSYGIGRERVWICAALVCAQAVSLQSKGCGVWVARVYMLLPRGIEFLLLSSRRNDPGANVSWEMFTVHSL